MEKDNHSLGLLPMCHQNGAALSTQITEFAFLSLDSLDAVNGLLAAAGWLRRVSTLEPKGFERQNDHHAAD